MAKPTSFRHPVSSRSDDRIAALIGDRGALGYGLYWMIIEAIHREESMRVDYCDKQIRRMAATMGADIHGFRTLLSELIDLYDLLAIEDGWLVSAIAYRKPKKAKVPTAIQGEERHADVSELPAAAPADAIDAALPSPVPESTDSMPAMLSDIPVGTGQSSQKRSQYNMRELRYYEELKEYIKAKAPRVAQMQEPITLDQSIEIQAGFEQDVIFATLLDMQRNENLTTDFTSAFYAFKLFTSGREYMKPRRSRGWSKPRPIATRILNEVSR